MNFDCNINRCMYAKYANFKVLFTNDWIGSPRNCDFRHLNCQKSAFRWFFDYSSINNIDTNIEHKDIYWIQFYIYRSIISCRWNIDVGKFKIKAYWAFNIDRKDLHQVFNSFRTIASNMIKSVRHCNPEILLNIAWKREWMDIIVQGFNKWIRVVPFNSTISFIF